MQVLRLPPRHHPKAEVTCPPLRWRAVRRVAMKCGALAAVSGTVLVLFLSTGRWWREPIALLAAGPLLALAAASLLGLVHVVRRTREPVVFKVARGDLTVTWPFLFTRRTRTVRTSDVTGIVAGPARAELADGFPAARLLIRRRHRRPIRVPGSRPVDEVTRAAEELRAVLRV